jgi:DNA replication licensing factor MCM2
LDSDDAVEEDLDDVELARMRKRTRRQYDERRDLDDMGEVEDVSCDRLL